MKRVFCGMDLLKEFRGVRFSWTRVFFFISASAFAALLFTRFLEFLFLVIVLLGVFCASRSFDEMKIQKRFSANTFWIAVLVAAACGICCYFNIINVQTPWFNIGFLKAGAIAVVGSLLAIYSVMVLRETIFSVARRNNFGEIFKKLLLKPFVIIFVIYLLSISAMMLADVHFIDDIYRNAYGISGWENFSRFLSNAISPALHGGTFLTNIAPLTQVIAVVIMALASVFLIYALNGHEKITFWNIIAVVPLGLSPYFIECFSYQYDAPYMALSVCASVIPILFINRSPKKLFVVTAICAIVACMTYQASLGILIVGMIAAFIALWGRKQLVLKSAFCTAMGFLLGVLVFRFFIMNEVATYVGTSMFSLSEMIPGVIYNIQKYYSYVIRDFPFFWVLLCALIFGAFVVTFTLGTARQRVLACLVACGAVILSACLCFGIYIVIDGPSFACRAMYGFGALIAIYALSCQNYRFAEFSNYGVLILSWCFFSFSFAYGNALDEQIKYNSFYMNALVEDISAYVKNSESPEDRTRLQIDGSFGVSPIVENSPYGELFVRLIQPSLHEYWRWIYNDCFYEYYRLRVELVQDLSEDDMPLVYSDYYYNIYADESAVLVKLPFSV
ncbi:MAG: glucosyltransferase domain-containing protein [Candidatus Saccharibacteria bacterium]|nr:glucosyltransferase domain-containing protein [Candidatus Saccharibacteria bacterium]